MSATLQISANSYWMPSGWIYDNALEAMASQLSDAPELASMLLDNCSDMSLLLDLSRMAPEPFQRLLRAAESALADTTQTGASAFAQPEFFPAYERKLKQLVDLMRADPRAASRRHG
jgi:hypothetical protein